MAHPILITGGSSGIGASLVRHLAGRYEVLTVARRIDRMERAYGDDPRVHPFELDLADHEAVVALVSDILDEWGHVPYVVNCAGTWDPKPVLDVSEDDLWKTFRVDAFAPVLVMRELLPTMREHDFGRVVNISGAGVLERTSGWCLQYAAKWALNAFTVAAAAENDDRNIKLNLVGPGPSNTEMVNGPLPPTACHPTVEYLLDLDADGPSGRFFWLGYELPLFPDLGDSDTSVGEPDEEHLRRVLE